MHLTQLATLAPSQRPNQKMTLKPTDTVRTPATPAFLVNGGDIGALMAEQGRHEFELIQKPYTSDALVRVFRKAIAEQTSALRSAPEPVALQAVF